jgi:hypothetical protein
MGSSANVLIDTFLGPSKMVTDTIGITKPKGSGFKTTAPVRPGQTDADREREARNAAAKRRKEYQDMGRSSTILTGGQGLAGSGAGEQKTLLGY